MVIRALTIAGSLLGLQAHVATAATATLELTTQEHDRLGQLACGADPESITAFARDHSRPGDYADVQCKPHSTHRGHEISNWTRCSRQGKAVEWHCEPPTATVKIEAASSSIQIHYTGVSTDSAVSAVSYLLSGPTSAKLHFDPTWLHSQAWVSAGPYVTVSSASHIATLRVPGPGEDEFELQEISHCETDVCVPL